MRRHTELPDNVRLRRVGTGEMAVDRDGVEIGCVWRDHGCWAWTLWAPWTRGGSESGGGFGSGRQAAHVLLRQQERAHARWPHAGAEAEARRAGSDDRTGAR